MILGELLRVLSVNVTERIIVGITRECYLQNYRGNYLRMLLGELLWELHVNVTGRITERVTCEYYWENHLGNYL